LVSIKFVIMKGVWLPNISLLYDHITLSSVYDYTCLLVKSLPYSSKYVGYCEYAACCMTGGSISDRGRDFTFHCQVLTGLQALRITWLQCPLIFRLHLRDL